MEETVPRIARESAPQGPVARTLGRWTAAQLTMPGVWSAVEASLAALKAEPGIGWDLRDLQRLDHLGAQALWNHWGHQWPAQLEVLPDQRAMLERVARFAVVPPPYRRRTLWEYFLGLGELLFKLTDHASATCLRLIGQLMLDLMRLARVPHRGPVARCVRPPVPHRRDGASHHGPGRFPDRRGAGLSHVAAATSSLVPTPTSSTSWACRVDPRAGPHAGGHPDRRPARDRRSQRRSASCG
jgi:hypothetical protein